MVKTIDATTTDRLRRSPLYLDLSPSCARKRTCMELTTICRLQRLLNPSFRLFQCFRSIASLPYKIVWEILHNLLTRNHVIIKVFRRETASGFYPWGNVVSPRKRVAVGLCGWRHGKLVSNAAKRTVAPPNAKHSTLLQGCFFMFLFLIPFTIRQQYIIYAPRNFPLSPCNSSNSVFFERIKKRLLPFKVIAVAIFCVFLI